MRKTLGAQTEQAAKDITSVSILTRPWKKKSED